jgi:hypothetical protein
MFIEEAAPWCFHLQFVLGDRAAIWRDGWREM